MRNTSPRSNASRSGRVWSWASCWWVFQSILPTDLLGIPVEWYLLRRPGAEIGVVWYVDILMRFVLFVLGCAWLVLMFNILPGKDNYLAYVGRNTMPVYIFHLVVRQWIKKHGITMGFFALPQAGSPLYLLLILGLASLCVVVFSSKPVSKFYDFVVDGLYDIFMWVINHIVLVIFGAVEKVLVLAGLGTVDWLCRQKTAAEQKVED